MDKKNENGLFSGVATALITPFCDGAIDFEALESLIEHQINGGVSALLVGGTTGESATLSDEEMHPLSVFLSKINSGEVGIAFAVAVIYMIPTLLVFLYGEDYLVEGIANSGSVKAKRFIYRVSV